MMGTLIAVGSLLVVLGCMHKEDPRGEDMNTSDVSSSVTKKALLSSMDWNWINIRACYNKS